MHPAWKPCKLLKRDLSPSYIRYSIHVWFSRYAHFVSLQQNHKILVHSVALHVMWVQCTFWIISVLLSSWLKQSSLWDTQNFIWDTGYLVSSLWFSLAPCSKCCMVPQIRSSPLLPHPLKFIIHYYQIIWCCIFLSTDSIIKYATNKLTHLCCWRFFHIFLHFCR
jgi:hypothetical protein